MCDEMADRTVTQQRSVSFCGATQVAPGIPAQLWSPAWPSPSRLRWASQPTTPGAPPCMQTRPLRRPQPSSRDQGRAKRSPRVSRVHGVHSGHYVATLPALLCGYFLPVVPRSLLRVLLQHFGQFVLTLQFPEPWLRLEPWLGCIGCVVLFQTSWKRVLSLLF